MSSDSSPHDRRTVVDHASQEQRRATSQYRKERLEESLTECLRALSEESAERYWYVGRRLRDDILPTLQAFVSRSWYDYDAALRNHRNWHWVAFSSFVEDPDTYVERVQASIQAPGTSLGAAANGLSDEATQAKLVVKKSLYSAAAIAEEEGVVLEDYASRVDAVGFRVKLAEHLQQSDMDVGDPVGLVTEQSGALKTLFTGGTGQGKSTALEREAEDYYRRTVGEGADYKLIDLVGIGDGENWFYDIPQQDDTLRDLREEFGLPPGLDELEYEPELEIRVPLTTDLPDQQLPYDTEAEEFVVEPFSIPASSIRKPLLVSLIVAKLTPQQESVVRDAYDEVDYRKDDWSLKDLADEIRSRDELDPKVKEQPIRTLKQLQRQGFIRTEECDHQLDWEATFRDAGTITVFSQAFLDGEIARLITIGYLAHTIIEERKSMHGVPECVLLMRELWQIVPHGKREAFDNRAAQLQNAIGTMLGQLFRANRHVGTHVLGDTQYYDDLTKSVRTMFNRYAVFHTSEDNIRQIFDSTASDRWRAFSSTISPDRGRASVVGMVEPAVERQNMDFVGPVEYVPPAHHHFMEGVDHAGWRARTRYRETEELRRPETMGVDWASTVPTKLMIESRDVSSGPDPETSPVQSFVDECLNHGPTHREKRTVIREAFNAFAQAHGRDGWDFSEQGIQQRFGTRLRKAVDGEVGRTTVERERAYKNLSLNERGTIFLAQARESEEDED